MVMVLIISMEIVAEIFFLTSDYAMLRAVPGLSSLGFTSKSIQVLQFIPRLQRRNQSYKEVNHLPKTMNAEGELEYSPTLVQLLSQYLWPLSVISVVSATDS